MTNEEAETGSVSNSTEAEMIVGVEDTASVIVVEVGTGVRAGSLLEVSAMIVGEEDEVLISDEEVEVGSSLLVLVMNVETVLVSEEVEVGEVLSWKRDEKLVSNESEEKKASARTHDVVEVTELDVLWRRSRRLVLAI